MHDLGITLGIQSSRDGPPPSNVAMLLTMPSSLSPPRYAQLVQQRLRFYQVSRVKPLGEPIVDRRQ